MSGTPKFQMLREHGAPVERLMPWSEEAEQQVLGACLLDGAETIARALQDGVTEKAFFSAQNRLLWVTIVDLFRANPPVTVETLGVELATRKQLEAAGGLAYLMQITGQVPTTSHATYFIQTLLEKSALRKAIEICTSGVEKAYAYTGGGVDALFADSLSQLSACVRHARRGSTMVTMREQMAEVRAEVRAAVEGKLDKTKWVFTRLVGFDKRCMPFGCSREDNLVVLAGGSGDGKSAGARQVALAALECKQLVRFYTRETSASGAFEQMAATRGALDLKHRETWTKDMLARFESSMSWLEEKAESSFWCVENTASTPLMTVEDLEDDARYFHATQGGAHLYVVDYLQLFGAKKRFSSREQEVAFVSHRLQALCRELGGVWLVLCQMNEKGLNEMRSVKRDANGKVIHRLPNAGDLRESQAIFHDADRVIALYRPAVDSRDVEQTSPNVEQPEVWWCQIKRRKGAVGVVKCWLEKRFTRFVELPSFASTAASVEPVSGGNPTKREWKEKKKS